MSITVILGITAIGTKLPPYIIFKGRQNAIIQKKSEKLDLVVNKKHIMHVILMLGVLLMLWKIIMIKFGNPLLQKIYLVWVVGY